MAITALSSLNFANRTKKIEVREIENEPIFKGCSRAVSITIGKTIDRQPLRPLASTLHNSTLNSSRPSFKHGDKKAKAFSVYSDQIKYSNATVRPAVLERTPLTSSSKRPLDLSNSSASQPNKRLRPLRVLYRPQQTMSKENIEDIIEKKVNDILAIRALDHPVMAPQSEISEKVQRRLELLEQKLDTQDDDRGQGLTFLLMAKQHAVRGEDASALRMFTLAKTHFPKNRRLDMKIEKLRGKIQKNSQERLSSQQQNSEISKSATYVLKPMAHCPEGDDEEYQESEFGDQEYHSGEGYMYKSKAKCTRSKVAKIANAALAAAEKEEPQTPRTKRLLQILNGRDVARIRLLKGVGIKKAEGIAEALCTGDCYGEATIIRSLDELEGLRGVSTKTIEAMRSGL